MYSNSPQSFQTLKKWQRACVANSKKQNSWIQGKYEYFWETATRDHPDGRILGSIFRIAKDGDIKLTSSFRIESDGRVTRAPVFLKKASL